MESPPILFDRKRLRKRRARAASSFPRHDFLWREAADRAQEIFSCITRDFPRMLALGGHCFIPKHGTTVFHGSLSFLDEASDLVMDEEFFPFGDRSLDAVVSLLTLHWVNDLPGVLAQIYRALKPDGLFLAILPGGETLRELRSVFASTEIALSGGVSPRIAPFLDVRDGGALLQRAGFALPVADSELLTVSYENLFTLMAELKGAGEVNMLQNQLQHFTPRRFFIEAAKNYADKFADEEGRLPATVEFITLTGWKPAPSQQLPAKRGSGQISLHDVLN